MSLEWIRENPPHWDEGKANVIGGAPDGAFDMEAHEIGALIPGEWWRVERNGAVVGYGWMDCTWGDAEILLAVDEAHRGAGIGSFILDRLEKEAELQGLNYLYNVVRPTHPRRAEVSAWLKNRRFRDSGDGLLRRQVGHGTRA